MDTIVDFILLAASGAAVFYCIMLNQKLEKLKSRENGLGATIASMSHTVDQAREAVLLARESSQENIGALGPLVEETRALIPQLGELVDVVSELAEIAIGDINAAGSDAADRLAARIDEARQASEEIRREIDSFAAHAEKESKEMVDVSYLDEIEATPNPTARVATVLNTARKARAANRSVG